MGDKLTKDEWLCTIDINNVQQGYAQCMKLIRWLEEIATLGCENMDETSEEYMDFFISRASSFGVNDLRVLLEQERYIESGESKKFMKITSKEMLMSGLKPEPDNNVFYYYLRVHLESNESDITDLQYLVLLLQAIPAMRNRIAIRILETEYETWTTSDYFRVSHYMRFIQQKYGCIYAAYGEKNDSLRLLREESSGTQSTFLPLIEIDAESCDLLNKGWHFTNDYNGEAYDKLYMSIYPRNCVRDDVTYSLFQIAFRMLFKNLPGRKYKTEKSKKELLDLVCELIEDVQGVSPLNMLLFGALVTNTNKLEYSIAKELLGKVQMLSGSIGQILDNIVSHSERKKGVFTFRLQRNIGYLKSHYPNYVNDEDGGCLELLVADSNQCDDIVHNFLNSDKADSIIKDVADKVYLQHLFGDYPDKKTRELWQAARNKKPELCHGLLNFSRGVSNLKGAIRVRSASTYESKDFKDIYYYNGKDTQGDKEFLFDSEYVPGTQFSVVINRFVNINSNEVVSKDEEWAFDFDKLVYATTYIELAQALTFDEKVRTLDLSEMLNEINSKISGQKQKDELSALWKNWFDSKIEDDGSANKLVYECDLDLLCEKILEDRVLGETFCKGFLTSRFFMNPNKSKYYSIIMRNPSAKFSLIFDGTLKVVSEQSIFAVQNVCVYFYPKQYRGDHLLYCAATLHDLLSGISINEEVFPRVFPYTLFIKNKEGNTLFEQELLEQANNSIYSRDSQGFKIPDTHMRLGNKVHLDAFYEMALFFENPNYAYYTAFLFLRRFFKDNKALLDGSKKLLLYGYASYSKAVIWAINQILVQYKNITNNQLFSDIAFVIYQNDLKIESDESQIQMYYSKANWQRNNEEIWNPEDTTLVMVVPISSSLTTFNKMKAELKYATKKDFTPKEYFTAFWVRNEYEDIKASTKEEEYYWQTVDPVRKNILSNIMQGEIHYLVSVTCKWRNPLTCEKCFPIDPILEYPLVETDPTSTIPTQQFYREKDKKDVLQYEDTSVERENDGRIERLKSNLVYGHISKGSNHFQYYVKTREYFQQERDEIAKWLTSLREQASKDNNVAVTSSNCINVLIIPQQPNNVEFGQYVYEYYFNGCAECIIINTEKEFRSNLLAEYSGLFNRLRKIGDPENNIRFHYIDVSVLSGNSFSRIMSLLSSCLECDTEDNQNGNSKTRFKIDQIFLLISRLSEASKQFYVENPSKNFHAYAEIKISAMRNFGDSCVSCKLQREARGFYKKAATKSISSYWEKKILDRECEPFDNIQNYENKTEELQSEGYRRMMCSHRVAHFIRPIQGADVSVYFAVLRRFFDELCCANTNEVNKVEVYKEITNANRKDWLAAGLKIIVRPFFSFDYKMRCVVMDLFLILSEYYIKNSDFSSIHKRIKNSGEKQYLLYDNNLEWLENFAGNLLEAVGDSKCQRLEYIRNNILKGLTDIKSNYILRKDTMVNLSHRIAEVYDLEKNFVEGKVNKNTEEFYKHYLRSILRMTHSSSDETKSVWLEYLLQNGEEYVEDNVSSNVASGIIKLCELLPEFIRLEFKNFLELLLIENNRPVYQAVLEFDKHLAERRLEKKIIDPDAATDEINQFLKEHHMRNASMFLEFQNDGYSREKQILTLQQLLQHLNDKIQGMERYQEIGKILQVIAESKAGTIEKLILFGKNTESESILSEYLKPPSYFAIYPEHIENEIGRDKSQEKLLFEEKWNRLQNDECARVDLEANGFYLLSKCGEKDSFDIFIMLDNNYDEMKKKGINNHQKIEPIYMYIPCDLARQQALELVRMILIFRQKLVEWLENDFNNEAIAVLSQQKHLAKILSTDKMGDHAENDFVECHQNVLMAATEEEFFAGMQEHGWVYAVDEDGRMSDVYEEDVLGDAKAPLAGRLEEAREWFLLRSYVNSRISRMYHTMVRTGNDMSQKEIINADTYYLRDAQDVNMRPATDLRTVFFTPIVSGYVRKNYLKQMMKVITFTVQDVPDYKNNVNSDIDERMKNLAELLEEFKIINFETGSNGQKYAYLAEYMAIILLDCFVSGLKAGDVWNHTTWGGSAFYELASSNAKDKCEIRIYREKGDIHGNIPYDYLVIENDNCQEKRNTKKGLGMSQAAIRWYIEGLWRKYDDDKNYPQVKTSYSKECDEYYTKLPILINKEE